MGRAGEQLVTWFCTSVSPPSASTFLQKEWIKRCPLYSHMLPFWLELTISWLEAAEATSTFPGYHLWSAGVDVGQHIGPGVMLLTQVWGEEAQCCFGVLSVHLSAKQEDDFEQGGFKMPGMMLSVL